MGGCRCTFRGCPNNTNNSPGMHFFHYPLKYPERNQLWMKYADTKHFLDLPPSKARNKVVCENHFRDECFMNYKRERLVQFAVPTLVRLPNGLVLDYEESDDPKPKTMDPPTSKHLIRPNTPPKGNVVTPSVVSFGDRLAREEFYLEEVVDAKEPRNKRVYAVYGEAEATKPKIAKPAKPPHILNSSLRNFTTLKARQQRQVSPAFSTPSDRDYNESEELCEEITINPIEADNTDYKNTELVIDIPLEETEPYKEHEEEEVPSEEHIIKSEYDDIISNYERKLKALQEKVDKHEAAAKVKNTQVETVSTSRPVGHPSGTLTKGQLFNGIKKYLSPSMAALVRMEMFGGPEREWKTDEKQVSMDLFRLGEQIFNYFRDEWRFRLPSKRDVEQWIAASDILEEDEDL